MTYSRKATSVLGALLVLTVSVPSYGGPQPRTELERNLKYGWSVSAELIFAGTVAAVDFKDDPKRRGPTVEVTVRVDTLQRGVVGNSLVRIRIEDELQTYRWRDGKRRVGETGIWFLHRVRQFEGGPPRGHLIRYMDRIELEEDPQFLAELMKYVVQDTVDKTVRANILNVLSDGKESDEEGAVIKFALEYDDVGALSGLRIVEQSGNILFNDHVKDTILQIHRRTRIPGQVKKTEIVIERKLL